MASHGEVLSATPQEQSPPARGRIASAGFIAAASAIACVTVLLLIGHILHGGLYSDDWGFAGDYTYASSPRYPTAVGDLLDLSGGRPVLALLHPLPYAVFGANPTPHLVLAAVLSALVALTFYALLRNLGIAVADAIVIALLSLAFPWSDSTKLWPTASINNVAVIFWILGVLLALRSLRAHRRRAYALHAGAVLLYLLSVMTYEAVIVVAFLSGALYFRRTTRRRALAFWSVDVVVLLGALAYDWVATSHARGVPSLRARIDDLSNIAREAGSLVARSLYPGADSRAFRGVLLLAISAVVLVALRRRADPEIRTWLEASAVGAVVSTAAFGAFAGSGLSPLATGVANRGNMLAGVGLALLVYAVIRLGVLLVLPHRPHVAAALSLLVGLALLAWYGQIVRHDAKLWDLAAERQERILTSLHEALPHPVAGTTIFLYGASHEVAPGIPVFSEIWDFNGAVKLLYDNGSLRAFPVPDDGLHCGPFGVTRPLGIHFDQSDRAAYGRIFTFDAETNRVNRLRSVADCRAVARRIDRRPGP